MTDETVPAQQANDENEPRPPVDEPQADEVTPQFVIIGDASEESPAPE